MKYLWTPLIAAVWACSPVDAIDTDKKDTNMES
jgi:hypothetical protein